MVRLSNKYDKLLFIWHHRQHGHEVGQPVHTHTHSFYAPLIGANVVDNLDGL